MVEIILQFSPPQSDSIKEIADQRFNGNVTEVVNEAVDYYLNSLVQKREQLKSVVTEIRQEIEAQGGFNEEELEQRIREYRRVRKSSS